MLASWNLMQNRCWPKAISELAVFQFKKTIIFVEYPETGTSPRPFSHLRARDVQEASYPLAVPRSVIEL
jgi:uncharacterized protein (DUF608 family)